MDTTAARILNPEREIANLAARLDGFEKRQKELAEWISQQGEGFYDAREERDKLAARLDALGVGFVALAERVAKLESGLAFLTARHDRVIALMPW